MRVLHITSTFPRVDGDVTGTFMAGLCAAQRDAGLEVRVVAPHALGAGDVDGIPVRRFRYGPSATEILAYRGGLLAAARSPAGAAMVGPYLAGMAAATVSESRTWRPDVIHAHWWFPAGAVVRAVTRTAGCPFVVTLHGSDVALLHRRALIPPARAVLRRAAATVAVSEALAAEATDLLGLEPGSVGVASMPVPPPGPPPSPAERPPGPLRVLAVGRLVPEKGFDVLVEAAGKAAAAGLDLQVEVVGAGPGLEALRRQAHEADAPVAFPGPLAPADLHRHMVGGDVVVVPSRREGLGLVAVEAVLLGIPVIASATGGLPEALGAPDAPAPGPGEWTRVDGGALVAPGDAASLAGALDAALNLDPPGPASRAAGRRHEPARVAERHLRLYEEAVTRSRGSHRSGR